MPVHVTTQLSLPSQTQASPGAQDFVVVGPVVVPASLTGAGGDEDSDEHAAMTTNASTAGRDFMSAS